jgi:integrase
MEPQNDTPETTQATGVTLAPAETGLADPVAARARAYVLAAKAPSTLRAYRADWQDFTAWCESRGAASLPALPQTVALYLAARAEDHRPATLTRRLTSIAKAHEAAGLPSPATVKHVAVSETLKGIKRIHGTAQTGKAPLVTADLQTILAHIRPGALGARDRALLRGGYCGGFRRSELAALEVRDLTWSDDGVAILLRRSKTDQEGQGRQVAIPRGAHKSTCPVRALRHWFGAAQIDSARTDPEGTHAPVFRAVDRHGNVRAAALDPNSIARIVKCALVRAGYPPANYAGHSLRAGFATQAARNGATAFDIMRQTGHRSVAIVSRYIREAELFRDSPASKLGL